MASKTDYRPIKVERMSDLQIHVHICNTFCEPQIAVHAIPFWL